MSEKPHSDSRNSKQQLIHVNADELSEDKQDGEIIHQITDRYKYEQQYEHLRTESVRPLTLQNVPQEDDFDLEIEPRETYQ